MEGSTEELRRGEGRRKQLTSRVGLILRRSRAARGWPWSAQARPQVLIGRSRIPHRAGCSHRRIRSMCWAESMVGGNDLPPRCDSTCDFQSLGPQPVAKNAVLGTAEEIFVLDNAFALIEGQPALVYTKTGPACALRGCDASTCRYAHFPAWSVRAFAAASMQSAQRTNSRIP